MGGGAMRTAAKAMLRGYHPSAAPSPGRRGGRPCPRPPPLFPWRRRWPRERLGFGGWAVEEETNPAPRLVFGPVPTLDEAKEATSDLTDAIEKVYFSGTAAEISGKDGQGNSSPEVDSIIPSMPRHVVQAFSLLHGSPEAQSVVASLASDKNVWDAVMKNEKVVQFYRNHQSTLTESAAENAFPATSPEKIDFGSEDTSEGSGFAEFFNGIRIKVVEMVSNISNFIQDLFGASSEATHSKAENSNSDSYVNAALGGSFIALAIGVILVVLVKRG
uniref:Uncharacterized protein n=1 Tax=Ananas comosus var. bracteatus TaxID=296719 RepID=A0A6V7QU67_ANACO